MFSYVAFKATNIYHSRMFCPTPSAHKFDASRWFQKRMANQKLKTKAEYFLLRHLMYSFLKTTEECR